MVKKHWLASLGAWLMILPLTAAHGAMLEKYQVLPQHQTTVQQYQAQKVTPDVPAIVTQTPTLYSDFANQISSFSAEETNKLYRNFFSEQNEAIKNKEFDKAKYYDQLLGIILNEMQKGVQ